jgi:hypothetical protein
MEVLGCGLQEIIGRDRLSAMGKGKEQKMYTIKEASEIIGAAVSSIRVWLNDDKQRQRRFPGARKESTPLGDYWVIPEDDLTGYEARKTGRPLKPEGELKQKRRVRKPQNN